MGWEGVLSGMRRLILLLGIMGCMTEPAPVSLTGTYDMVSRNGKPLPTWFDSTPGRVYVDTLRSSVLVVNTDRTWLEDQDLSGEQVHFVGSAISADSAGFNFLITPGSALYRRGVLRRDTLTVQNADGTWRFVRRH